ncbi:MAG: dihydroorotate dehydrogenase [Verrucomicrobia bacterium]|nr:dihydroorotate dehydrogenase [Verrucomicrobiota bacterium]MBU4365637.1 dihydroorotate dehydrogenase [Verrucomicrobiota bacterium]
MTRTLKRIDAHTDLTVRIGGLVMQNPVMTASGTFGYGPEFARLVDLNRLGAIVVKGISLKPAQGNPTPRLVEVPGGLLNAIGLQNPGFAGFVSDYLPFLRQYQAPVIVNIWGHTIEEYAAIAERFSDVPGVHGLELNISCPNIKRGGIAFGTDPKMARQVITAVRKRTRLPLITKLSPNVTIIAEFARIAEACGADAVSLINSFPAMAIDIETRRPILANITGGLTGPAIHTIALKMVWEAAQAVKIPVIGMGGITSAKEALAFIIAGASAIAVGTANFTEPLSTLAVIKGIEAYLVRHRLPSVRALVGTLETGSAS